MEVPLLEKNGREVALVIVQFVGASFYPHGGESVGESHIGAVICKKIYQGTLITPHNIQKWQIKRIVYRGVSLEDHELLHKLKLVGGNATLSGRKGKR